MAQTNKYKIGIAGVGCVGGAALNHFENNTDCEAVGYDKYVTKYQNNFDKLLECDMIFFCLPTLYEQNLKEYDKSAIYEVSRRLNESDYNGLAVIKSTVEPGTCERLSKLYPNVEFAHNPEFLTARTCREDFTNQTHIVLGKTEKCSPEKFQMIQDFYHQYWPNADYSVGNSWETEAMKIFCNTFYSIKIATFNEFYLLCEKSKQDFGNVVSMMLKNKWINPMHTKVPGPDGKLGYGGMCFPKDSNALNQHMEREGTPHATINGACEQNPQIRGSWD